MKTKNAFTLIEIVFAIAILAILLGLAVPAIKSSLSDSTDTAGTASAQTYNQAITRVGLKGEIPAVLTGSDQDAAIEYLVSNGWIN